MRISLIALVAAVVSASPAWAQDAGPHNLEARAILKELVEINTTDSSGSTTRAAEAMAARLKAAGFADADVQVLGPNPRKGNLVARLRGRNPGKPIVLLAHLDVVEALKADWSADLDPFVFTERDGYFYGRGTSDDKNHAAIWIANLIRYKQEGFVPARDIVVALTADEEGGDSNGVKWLLENHRSLIDADYVLNEGGGGELKDGKAVAHGVQAAEKKYYSVALDARNAGGHSSLPRKDNAIYQLAAALTKLAAFEFPVELNEITRSFFARMASLETAQVAADMKAVAQSAPDAAAAARLAAGSPMYNSMMRSTCVATQLTGGHAENALPQQARAVVNCRLLPGSDPRAVEQTLKHVVADEGIVFTTLWEPVSSPASPLRPDLMAAVERHTTELWPGAIVLPFMSTGATDGLYLRNAGIPTYGVEGMFTEANDVRAHGKDERVGIKAFYDAREFLYRLVKTLGS
ncbi:MAG: M20/M25/M40 family metallo-hydrolase [Vicinamibacterales bacterium]|jgi:acetylornithine deacetylase/succinyl-diaminopimelate desuccinylase-like protein|nr:M20/M25/M40 family metallo-hydrolase [Vicinamibacterales bacterium]